MPVEVHSGFLQACPLMSREYVILKNSLVLESPTGQAIKFTVEHEVETRTTFEFEQNFAVSIGTSFATPLPAVAPNSLVVKFVTTSAWRAARTDRSNTHFVAEFNARAEARTNVTARGLLDIGSANVPFSAEVGRFWENILGEIIPYVYAIHGVFTGY